MDIIKISGLTHRYPDGRTSLEEIDLSVARGSFVVLAGANGAGKSTLLKHLNGLLRPQEGSVEIAGVPVHQDLRHARRTVGMVFQDADSQIVGETVYDDAAFGPENLHWPAARIRESVDSALETVGLGKLRDRSPHLLSGGEKRRLAIAGVLAMASEVIVLDEPFANLDYDGVRQVLAHIVALHAGGRTIIVCVHDLEKVLAHAQRLIILQRGRIAADGPPEQVVRAAEACGIRLPAAIRMGGMVESWLR
ncbi:ABC transporter ATP-binding protein [Desulfoprunum benzoelyticum]|uniref:Biotin transport system ATP-binding protein n=1 Tax=Desulfoprunum benzoelyticum TaxID=1506996 RepID=A0A840V2C1_9BACT|nr:ABC transporter ATP-binding protein [Desulfoprunum benzoelyticum]MBB5347869.1 biotin transport system ATP-binding protein [Desulfoprunum benzoelyticum]MBM9531739.1 ABC transporter ATP-binding protein [Desulfoprunum benzoelyticum]